MWVVIVDRRAHGEFDARGDAVAYATLMAAAGHLAWVAEVLEVICHCHDGGGQRQEAV